MKQDNTEISDIVTEVSSVIDISRWDPRTIEILKQYPESKMYFEGWKRLCKGNPKGVEGNYLRHVAEELAGTDKSIESRIYGLIIFRLAGEVYKATGISHGYVFQMIEMLEKNPEIKAGADAQALKSAGNLQFKMSEFSISL